VATLDERGVDARLEDRLAGLAGRLLVGDGDTGQHLGLVGVGRRDRRSAQEVLVGAFGLGLEQPVAGGGDHHGVDHQREVELAGALGDGLDDLGRREHPGFRRAHVEVVGDGLELRLDLPDREDVGGLDAPGVLGGDGGDRRRAEDAVGGHRREVGLDPRAAAGVAARDRQPDRSVFGCWRSHRRSYSAVVLSDDGR
jgi:hypothetical protein